MRVLFITTGLATGGAEKQLARLLSRLHPHRLDAHVVSLLPPGPVSREIMQLGVTVEHLGMVHPLHWPRAAARLAAITRRVRPALLQGWMYHGNLAAWWAHRWWPKARLVLGVRQSLYDLAREKTLTRQVIRWNAAASRRAAAIVYNSELARAQHEAFGFHGATARVIGNGFDTDHFHPDEAARAGLRAELGIAATAPLIGLIARYHPMKGHTVFLAAAARLAEVRPDVHFLLVGRDVEATSAPFVQWKDHPRLAARLHFLGERHDIARLTAALDIASSSSSWGEAFPNAIGEAMSCAVPCVATDVGDVGAIVGETGIVVPPGDAEALARGWETLLGLPQGQRRALGQAARQRVMAHFSLDRVAADYAKLYKEIIDGKAFQ